MNKFTYIKFFVNINIYIFFGFLLIFTYRDNVDKKEVQKDDTNNIKSIDYKLIKNNCSKNETNKRLAEYVNTTLLSGLNYNFKIAVQIHVYYADLIKEILDYIENIPKPFDILITTNTLNKYNIIKNELDERNITDNYFIDFAKNIGMDVYPFIFQMKKYLNKYDIVCHIHTKKSIHGKIPNRGIGGKEWRLYLYNRLMGSRYLVNKILSIFYENEKLGIVFPDVFYKVKPNIKWGCNYIYAKKIMYKSNKNITLPKDIIFPAGNMFWARTKAIKKFIDIDIIEKDFDVKNKLDCTILHSIERLWVYIVKESGFDWLNYNVTLNKNNDIKNKITNNITKNVINKSNIKIKNLNEINSNEKAIGVCAIAKLENLYIREWLVNLKHLGVSKVFLYDNNDVDGEKFEDVINDYIQSGYVNIINMRGNKTGIQFYVYTECYKNNKKDYSWLLFIDIDEFIFINNTKYGDNYTLIDFLSDKKFEDFEAVGFKWKIYGDNDLIYYEDKPVNERFGSEDNFYPAREIKVAIRGGLNYNIIFNNPHFALVKTMCGTNGISLPIGPFNDDEDSYNYAYIKHFIFKSTEEFYNKVKRNSVSRNESGYFFVAKIRIKGYFMINKLTLEKISILKDLMVKTNIYGVYANEFYSSFCAINILYNCTMFNIG